MNVADLKDGMQRVDAQGEVVELQAPRTVNTKKGAVGIAEGRLRDATGQIGVGFWGAHAERVKEGDHVKIGNGYVTSYRGAAQLQVGQWGTLDVVEGKADQPPPRSCASCGTAEAAGASRFCHMCGEALG